MLYMYPEFSASGLPTGARSQPVITRALREDAPAPAHRERVEHAVFNWGLPLRYSCLPVRRRLTRMMLTLQRCGEGGDKREREAFTPAADYARSVIDTAMLRGELRCRPSGEMAHAWLMLTRELLSLTAGAQQDKALLRREVHRRTADFLSRYGAEARV